MRNPRRTVLPVVLITAALATVIPAQPAAALPPPGPGVPVWAADWMKSGSGHTNYDPGRTAAMRQARRFDVVIAHGGTYDNHAAAMKAANPNLRLFVYVQGMFSPKGGFPSRWYARNGSGGRIRDRNFGTFLMNPKSQGWRDNRLAECRQKVVASHYQGCFLDSLGPTGMSRESMTARPIDPGTGRAYTRRNWLGATVKVAQRVRSAMSPRPVLMNGLVDGSGYFNSAGRTEQLLNGATGGMSEAFVRPAKSGASAYKSRTAWKHDVNMLADIGRRPSGGIAFAVTKVWSRATSKQIASWHRYALGSFLLGYRPGHGYFQFRSHHQLTTPSAYEDIVLGAPTGSYVRVNGMYVRNFQRGKVIVNPTTSKHPIHLSRRFVDLSGIHRSGRISLAPHTARILKLA